MQLKLSGTAAGLLLSTKDQTGKPMNALVLEAMELLAAKYKGVNSDINNSSCKSKQQ